MKNLASIILALFVLSSLTSCHILLKLKATGGVVILNENVEAEYEDDSEDYPEDTDIPNEDTDIPSGGTDAAKKAVNKPMANNNYSSSSNEAGFYIGLAYSDIDISNKFSLQPELRFVWVKDFNQIQAPILLRYYFADKFSAYAGPNFAYLLDPPNGLNNFNFALDFGASYDISNKFSVEARYDWGLTNLVDSGIANSSVNLSSFQIGVAYKFRTNK